MNILLVCNNAFTRGNGLCTAIEESLVRLTHAGHEVRILSVANPDKEGRQPYYPLKHFKFPVFEPIIYANGFCYASIEKDVMTAAIAWADVVHLEEALPLQYAAVKIAKELGKPCVATFHLYAENITANLGMKPSNPVNTVVTWAWRKLIYDKCTDIHCPAEAVRAHLERNGYKARLHVFSNGIEPASFRSASKPDKDPYIILCTGRLSSEKSQATLLEAMRHSRHAGQIQLVFAGNGPKRDKYMKLADELMSEDILKYRPTFSFYPKDELNAIARRAYLYVHCAWVEVEGLSCLEAIREGAVPVIAESKLVSTSQFALDEHSRYPAHDSKALADRIDWWIEHPAERKEMSQKYIASVDRYSATRWTEKMTAMYWEAIHGLDQDTLTGLSKSTAEAARTTAEKDTDDKHVRTA